jgi:hypothetical protein
MVSVRQKVTAKISRKNIKPRGPVARSALQHVYWNVERARLWRKSYSDIPKVILTTGWTHTNLDSKVAAVGKLSGNCCDPVTVGSRLQQVMPRVSQIGRELREYVSIRNGRAGERLKPAVLKNEIAASLPEQKNQLNPLASCR